MFKYVFKISLRSIDQFWSFGVSKSVQTDANTRARARSHTHTDIFENNIFLHGVLISTNQNSNSKMDFMRKHIYVVYKCTAYAIAFTLRKQFCNYIWIPERIKYFFR